MSYLENFSDGEFETAVAATAYAISTLEKEEESLKQKTTVEGLTRTKSKPEDKTTTTSSNWSKWLSGKKAKHDEKQTEENEKVGKKHSPRYIDDGEESGGYIGAREESYRYIGAKEESSEASPTVRKMPNFTKKDSDQKATKRIPNGKESLVGSKATSSRKPAGFSSGYKNWDENSNDHDKTETEAEAWEKAEMINAKKRYENMMSVISEWQTEKKAKAKRRMEKKQGGPEDKRAKAWQHYNNEISRINKIAGNARALAKERMQNDEMKIRGKAAKIRSTGKVPGAYCTCC